MHGLPDLKRSTFVVWEMWRHHNMCWKWPPFASRQDWIRRAIFWKVLASTSAVTAWISHTTNVLLFKFRCNIFIGVRIIKEMPGFGSEWDILYMPVTENSHASYPHYPEVGPYKFQVVHNFTYLWSYVNYNNDMVQKSKKKKTYSSRRQVLLWAEKARWLDLKKH